MLATFEKHFSDMLLLFFDIFSIIGSLLIATDIRFGNPFAFPDYAYPTVFIAMISVTIGSLLVSGADTHGIFCGIFHPFFSHILL
jgi:hypothetical protein